MFPAFSKCGRCGVGAEAYPNMTWAQILDRCEREPAFKKSFETTCDAQEDTSLRTWKPASVSAKNTIGIRVEHTGWLVALPDFFKFTGVEARDVKDFHIVEGVFNL